MPLLCIDLIIEINKFLDYKCHTCNKKIKFLDNYIMNKKFKFCSKKCYNFI